MPCVFSPFGAENSGVWHRCAHPQGQAGWCTCRSGAEDAPKLVRCTQKLLPIAEGRCLCVLGRGGWLCLQAAASQEIMAKMASSVCWVSADSYEIRSFLAGPLFTACAVPPSQKPVLPAATAQSNTGRGRPAAPPAPCRVAAGLSAAAPPPLQHTQPRGNPQNQARHGGHQHGGQHRRVCHCALQQHPQSTRHQHPVAG